jgi:hypothetical protein
MLTDDSIYTGNYYWNFTFESIRRRSPMASKENKCKYTDEEEELSTTTSKRRHAFGNDDSSSEEDVSSEEEPAR